MIGKGLIIKMYNFNYEFLYFLVFVFLDWEIGKFVKIVNNLVFGIFVKIVIIKINLFLIRILLFYEVYKNMIGEL